MGCQVAPCSGRGNVTPSTATLPQGARETRLSGIDGLRAFAALWVVLFHIRAFSGARLHGLIAPFDLVVRSGSTGVSLFLVISGFCLYLPFAAGRQGRFKTRDFLVRRVKRLMPAYYASLAFFALLYAVGGLGLSRIALPDLGGQLVTHATMTHQLFPGSFYALNGAYWSLGLEWELYLALPLLIIGIRRFGLLKTALAAVGFNIAYRLLLWQLIAHGVIPAGSALATAVLPNQLPGRWAEFVFGMIAAELFASGRLARWAGRIDTRVLVLAPVALTPLSLLVVGTPLSHLMFGGVFFLLLCAVLATDNPVRRAFNWRPLVRLGLMSYSLYLVHQPLVQAGASLFRTRLDLTPSTAFLALILCIPLIILAAWLLFTGVERYTLTSRPSRVKQGAAIGGLVLARGDAG